MEDLREISNEEIREILEQHKLWLESSGKKGQRANLENTDLIKKDLSKANLSKATLIGCIATRADFSSADMSYADLRNVGLACASIMNATLEKADLEYANLDRASLKNANLRHANLSGAILEAVDLTSANLTGVYLYGTDLSGIRGVEKISAEYVYVGTRENSIRLAGDDLSSWLKAYSSICTIIQISDLGKIMEALEEYKPFEIYDAEKRIKGFSRMLDVFEEAYKFGLPIKNVFDRKIDYTKHVLDKGRVLNEKIIREKLQYEEKYGNDDIFRLNNNLQAMIEASKRCRYLNN